jgi:site-specific recombinase XerD
MKNLLADFRTFLEVERNVSEHTRLAYLTDIEEFNVFLQGRDNPSGHKTLDAAGRMPSGRICLFCSAGN